MDFKGGQSLRDLEMSLRRWDVPCSAMWMVTGWLWVDGCPSPPKKHCSHPVIHGTLSRATGAILACKNEKNSNNDPFQEEQFFSQVFLPFSNHNQTVKHVPAFSIFIHAIHRSSFVSPTSVSGARTLHSSSSGSQTARSWVFWISSSHLRSQGSGRQTLQAKVGNPSWSWLEDYRRVFEVPKVTES